jgi:alpha-1,2-mannosyltransferase
MTNPVDRVGPPFRAVVLLVSVGTSLYCVAQAFFGQAFTPDFTAFWAAARLPVSQVYDVAAVDALQQPFLHDKTLTRPFVYPPTFLPYIEPLGWLPMWPALGIWVTLAVAALLSAARTLDSSWQALAVGMLAPAVAIGLLSGQTVALVGAAALAACALVDRRPLVAGVLFGLAATIKPQALICVPVVLLVAGRWRALLASLAAGGAAGLLSLAVHPHLWLEWWRAVQAFPAILASLDLQMGSMGPAGVAQSFNAPPELNRPIWAFGAIGATAIAAYAWRTSKDRLILAATVLGACVVASPYGLGYEATAVGIVGGFLLMDLERPELERIAGGLLLLGITAGALVAGLLLLGWSLMRRDPDEMRERVADA